MDKDVILIGAFHEIIELCEDSGVNIIGIIDNIKVNKYMGYSIIGTDKDASALFSEFKNISIIITPDLPLVRKKLFDHYTLIGYKFTSLISKEARISKSARIGKGAVIQNGVNVSSFSVIGDFVKLNTYSNIMHDSLIGDFTTVAPNTVVLGRVVIQNYCYIGSNSTILPNMLIGESTTVGAGAVVTRNTGRSDIVVGIPAKKRDKNGTYEK